MKITRRQLRRLIAEETKAELTTDEKEAAESKISDEGGAMSMEDLIKLVNDVDQDTEYSEAGAKERLKNSIDQFEEHEDGDAYTNRPNELKENLTRKLLKRLIKEELKRLSYVSKEQGYTYGLEHLPDEYDQNKADDL